MSVATRVINESKSIFDHLMSIKRIFYSYLIRNNPLKAAYANINISIKNILTANQKLRIAKYRVTHYKYRLYQMEQLINENNPSNHFSGRNINQIR